MKSFNASAIMLFIGYIILSNISCKNTATQPDISNVIPVRAPERTLSPDEIMKLQGITSIHFVSYDSVRVNEKEDSAFIAKWEYYYDSCRTKAMQYYLDDHNWSVTVNDLSKNIGWRLFEGTVTLFTPQSRESVFNGIQARLGSWLEGSVKYLGRKYLGDKLCDVFEGTGGYQEWVWVDYRLPVQRVRLAEYDNLTQVTYTQMRDIEINKKFPDSIFAPPK